MITEEYVSYEIAKLLKEKGFTIPYDSFRGVYINGKFKRLNPGDGFGHNPKDEVLEVCSPQMAMKWLREACNRYVEICMDKAYNFKDIVFRPAIYDKRLDCLWESDNFPTYEEACEAAIKYCLEKLI